MLSLCLCELLLRAKVRKVRLKKEVYSNIITDSLFHDDLYQLKSKLKPLMLARSVPIVGWTMFPNVDNGVVKTDAYGFRNKETDLKGKTVLAVFGDSVALGGMASGNEYTIPGWLQHYLQEECGGDVVVLNLAQSAFTLLQQVSLFNLLLEKLDIKISIFVVPVTDVQSFLLFRKQYFGFVGPFFEGWKKPFNNLEIIKADSFFQTMFRVSYHFSFLVREAHRWYRLFLENSRFKSKRPVMPDCYAEKILESTKSLVEIIENRLLSSDRKALMILQPVIFEGNSLTSSESRFLHRFDDHVVERWRRSYDALKTGLFKKKPEDIGRNAESVMQLADFTTIQREAGKSIFVDDCHFAEKGNELIAENVFSVLKSLGWLESVSNR